ncbi:hypothetical protein SVIOM74S_06163 [Streptomyces violarus]
MTHTANSLPHTSDSLPLTGRVAVVTGASSGIGAATARRLADGGASVALLGRREDRLEALARDLRRDAPGAVLPVAVDLTDAEAVPEAARAVAAALGAVDLVVANAGVMRPAHRPAGRRRPSRSPRSTASGAVSSASMTAARSTWARR